jgi:hypothetical protein
MVLPCIASSSSCRRSVANGWKSSGDGIGRWEKLKEAKVAAEMGFWAHDDTRVLTPPLLEQYNHDSWLLHHLEQYTLSCRSSLGDKGPQGDKEHGTDE